MKKSLRVMAASLIVTASLGLTACNEEDPVVRAPGQERDLNSKTEAQAHDEAQDLLDNTVGS